MKRNVITIVIALICAAALCSCGSAKDAASGADAAVSAAIDTASLSDEYKPWGDKYTAASEKLSQCLPVEGADVSTDELQKELGSIAGSISKENMSDSDKTNMDMLVANIDNLYAQSKNMCDTKLNDIIALSQGDYSGDFVSQMNDERAKYDELINQGKYKDAYDQLLAMEEMYKSNQ